MDSKVTEDIGVQPKEESVKLPGTSQSTATSPPMEGIDATSKQEDVELPGTSQADSAKADSKQTVDGTEKTTESQAATAGATAEKKEEKKAAGPKLLDLAFGMDCTGSMGSYIHSAQQGIRGIVEEIVSKEAADVRLALVQYRDHPPQDTSFVTRVNDFTKSVREMKGWLDSCSASGGGDGPEAVADALHQLLKLNWRENATKIVVFISDAPPHGLDAGGDGFPDGCPDGLDPMVIVGQMAEKGITMYQVGCEPAINRYKEFFTGLAHVTGGQYVPLRHAELLAKVIVGGAQEEISLQQLMAEVHQEVEIVVQQQAAPCMLSHSDISSRIYSKLASKGVKSKKMTVNEMALPKPSTHAKNMSHGSNMREVQSMWQKEAAQPMQQQQSLRGVSLGASGTSKKPSSKRQKKGVFGSLKDRMMGSKPEANDSDDDMGISTVVPASACDGPSPGAPAAPRPPGAGPSTGAPAVPKPPGQMTYEVMENADIGEEQVYRMVQKSVMQQNLRSQLKRDSDSD